MFCNYCGNPNPDVAKFCRKCGKPVVNPAQPADPVTPAPVAQPLVAQPLPQTPTAPPPVPPPLAPAIPTPAALPTPPPVPPAPAIAAPPMAHTSSRTKVIAVAASIAVLLIGGLVFIHLRSGRPKMLAMQIGFIDSMAFSPDGRQLAIGGSDGSVELWDAASGQWLRTFNSYNNTSWVAFSPDGRTLASSGGSSGKGLILWDAASGNKIRVLAGDADFVGPASFSSDGRLLAATINKREGNEIGLRLWDPASGNELRRLPGYTSPNFSPDSKLMEAESTNYSISLLDAQSDNEVRTLAGTFLWVRAAIFSSDGHVLAIANNSATITLWDVSSGKELREINDAATVRDIAFSPDSRLLASGSEDHTIKLWDVSSGDKVRTLSGHSDAVNSVAFSPDGRMLASGGADGKVFLWPLPQSR